MLSQQVAQSYGPAQATQAEVAPQESSSSNSAAVEAMGAGTYTVVEGDTLSLIAQAFVGDVMRYVELWQANKGQVPDPNVIEIGQVLVLPSGWPARPGGAPAEEAPVGEVPEEAPEEETPAGQQPGQDEPVDWLGDAPGGGQGEGPGWWEDLPEEEGPEEDGDDLTPDEREQVDILLDTPWFSQFYFYDPSGTPLTHAQGHGAVQPDGNKALTSKDAGDVALAGSGPFLFEPGDLSCFKAAVAMAETGGVDPSGPYDSIQIFYSGDEEGVGMSGDREMTELDRSDPGRMAEIGEQSREGIAYLDAELDLGHPILVGVSYWANVVNNVERAADGGDAEFEGQTRCDHFVTVIGREGSDVYVFNDPGSQWVDGMQGQHFVRDGDDILVRDEAEVEDGGKAYEVSHIRKNA